MKVSVVCQIWLYVCHTIHPTPFSGRVLGLVMGSVTSSGGHPLEISSPRKPHALPSTGHPEVPQDPAKLFRSLSHDNDGEVDSEDEGEGNIDDDNEDAEGRFFELPSTSHRSPLAPQFFHSSIERRLKRINERVDKVSNIPKEEKRRRVLFICNPSPFLTAAR